MPVSDEVLDRYDALLDRTDAELLGLYEMLTDLSQRLDPTVTWTEEKDDLSLRMALSQVQSYVLEARDKVHGGITKIITARTETYRRRPLS